METAVTFAKSFITSYIRGDKWFIKIFNFTIFVDLCCHWNICILQMFKDIHHVLIDIFIFREYTKRNLQIQIQEYINQVNHK